MAHYVKEEICLNSSRTAVVSCDSPAAHFKLTPPRGHMEDDEAKALGLLEAPAEEAPQPEQKAVTTAPANKAVDMPKGKK